MRKLKQECVCLRIKYLVLLGMLICGQAYALPQDWPCGDFKLKEYKVEDGSDKVSKKHYYKGKQKQYLLEIELNEQAEGSHQLDDCGTSGCSGTITDTLSSQQEIIDFYCQPINDDATKINCFIHNDSEFLFTEESGDLYKAKQCLTENENFYQLDVRLCEQCKCLIEYYEMGQKKNDSYLLNCTREGKNQIRCFSAEGYILRYNSKAELNDYENCVGLKI